MSNGAPGFPTLSFVEGILTVTWTPVNNTVYYIVTLNTHIVIETEETMVKFSINESGTVTVCVTPWQLKGKQVKPGPERCATLVIPDTSQPEPEPEPDSPPNPDTSSVTYEFGVAAHDDSPPSRVSGVLTIEEEFREEE
jgi:hypothetical protein